MSRLIPILQGAYTVVMLFGFASLVLAIVTNRDIIQGNKGHSKEVLHNKRARLDKSKREASKQLLLWSVVAVTLFSAQTGTYLTMLAMPALALAILWLGVFMESRMIGRHYSALENKNS